MPWRMVPSVPPRKSDAVGHHHAHDPLGVGDGEHVLEEGEVTLGLGRDGAVAVEAVVGVVGGEAVVGVVGGEVAPPLLQAEGGIGDDAIVGEQSPALVPQLGVHGDVAALVAGGAQAVQE